MKFAMITYFEGMSKNDKLFLAHGNEVIILVNMQCSGISSMW